MKIVSNERYKKLKKIEMWEEVRPFRNIISPKKDDILDLIRWTLEYNIPEFCSVNVYSKEIKIKKGEVGILFGKSIIVK